MVGQVEVGDEEMAAVFSCEGEGEAKADRSVVLLERKLACACGRDKRNKQCERNKEKQEEGMELSSILARTGERDDRRAAREDDGRRSRRNNTRDVAAVTLRLEERIALAVVRRDRTLGSMPPVPEVPDEAEVTEHEEVMGLGMEWDDIPLVQLHREHGFQKRGQMSRINH